LYNINITNKRAIIFIILNLSTPCKQRGGMLK
jgi:hypothetical protein